MRRFGSTTACTLVFAVVLAAWRLSLAASADADSPGSAPQRSPTPAPPSVKIAASIFPLADIARQIGGDRVSVTTIIPPGSDPHNFELTPTGARAVNEADLVLLIARHFDGWALAGEGTGGSRRWTSRRTSPGTAKSIEFETILRDSLIKTGRDINPHFWLDPAFAQQIAARVATRLTELDPASSAHYDQRAVVFLARLDSLDASVRARLEKSGFKEYVAMHPAWTYFARRYGLIERAILERTPEQEPSAKWVSQVLKTMKQYGIGVIIAEEFSNKALAETMANDSGATMIVLDPLGGTDRPGRDSYISLMDYNVRLMEEAMQ